VSVIGIRLVQVAMKTPTTVPTPDELAARDPPASEHEYFLSLLEAHQRPLLKVCWVYGNTSHDRDDLFQEIVGQLWTSFGKYDRTRKFSTWMYRVALNVAIDFRRKQKRAGRETTGLDEDRAVPVTAVDDVTRQDQLLELRELLERQSDADRAILLLHLEGHSHREIGEVLGTSESNVGTRLHRVKQSLRQAVQAEPGEAKGT
jgi:RNA polymerase sigma factor (sigma-70 family)